MDPELAEAVRLRAVHACEYCRMPQRVRRLRFQIEHVISRQHHGGDALENLASASGGCNRHKGPTIAGIDPDSRQLTRLFNPRADRWEDHFRWEGATIVGVTSIGRTTVDVVVMNHPEEVAVRLEMIDSGQSPPAT